MRGKPYVLAFATSVLLMLLPQAFADPLPTMGCPAVTYTTVGTQLVCSAFTGSSTDYLPTINNQTGQTWTDFHFLVGHLPGTPGINFAGYSGPGTFTISSGTVEGQLVSELDVVGLNIASGASYTPTLTIGTLEGFGIIVGTPSVGGGPGPSVPEPASFLIFGLLGSLLTAVASPHARRSE